MFLEIINIVSIWAIPFILFVIPLYALIKKVEIYETFIDGAKEGFNVGVRIIPYLVAILVAIGMFRASGALDMIAHVCEPILSFIHMPIDILPLAVIRSLSGSGALGVLTEIVQEHGVDSYVTKLAAVMVGSSETTFYVLAVYFGSVGIKNFRHAVATGIIADLVGIIGALFICSLFFA